MEEDEIMIEDDAIALEDTDDSSRRHIDVSGIIPFIMERYKKPQKTIAIKMKSAGFGHIVTIVVLYGPDVQFTESEKSRVFIKVTKTKTLGSIRSDC